MDNLCANIKTQWRHREVIQRLKHKCECVLITTNREKKNQQEVLVNVCKISKFISGCLMARVNTCQAVISVLEQCSVSNIVEVWKIGRHQLIGAGFWMSVVEIYRTLPNIVLNLNASKGFHVSYFMFYVLFHNGIFYFPLNLHQHLKHYLSFCSQYECSWRMLNIQGVFLWHGKKSNRTFHHLYISFYASMNQIISPKKFKWKQNKTHRQCYSWWWQQQEQSR